MQPRHHAGLVRVRKAGGFSQPGVEQVLVLVLLAVSAFFTHSPVLAAWWCTSTLSLRGTCPGLPERGSPATRKRTSAQAAPTCAAPAALNQDLGVRLLLHLS